MMVRVLLVAGCLFVGAGYISYIPTDEILPSRVSLENFPVYLGVWTGHDMPALSSEVTAILGADEYVNRVYASPAKDAIALYVGYYRSQRQGDTIHSPLNCLPGSGWQPVARRDVVVPLGDPASAGAITVNRVIVQKGLERQLVMYWYQSHGRAVANEYRSKILLVYDAVRLNRTDAALVRLSLPVIAEGPGAEAAAQQRAEGFLREMYPVLAQFIPS